jgi:HD superfamily phosphodiesterase
MDMIGKKLTSKEGLCLEEVHVHAKNALDGRDGSHDFAHANRVLGNCLRMCDREEELTGAKVDYLVIGICCLVHDIEDAKYAGDIKYHGSPLEEYLTGLKDITPMQSNAILFIIRHLGFRNELDREKYEETLREAPPEFFLIQDADRLDAIGAVGIARYVVEMNIASSHDWRSLLFPDHFVYFCNLNILLQVFHFLWESWWFSFG